MAKTKVINPITNKAICQGGRLHLKLIAEGKLDRSTLDDGKVSIVEGSRQMMEKVKVEYHTKTTHFLNIREISKCIEVNEWVIIQWLTKNFSEMKICYSEATTLLVFPGREIFLQNCIDDFITEYSEKNKLDITYWNQ
jgi:hypothetical protein